MAVVSKASKASSPNVKIQDVPDAPTIGTPTIGPETVVVPFTPATTGGAPAQYRVTNLTSGSETVVVASPATFSPATGNPLAAGAGYTFVVTGVSAAGVASPLSANSVSASPVASYELISTQVLTGNPTTVSFTSIPSFYKHLQFRISMRQTGANSFISTPINFNGDGAGNYSWHRLYGTGTGTGADSQVNSPNILLSGVTSGNDGANSFSAAIVDVLDYSSTSKNKTVRAIVGGATFTNGQLHLDSGAWRSTAAIDRVDFNVQSTSFAVGSRFSLYGIRG